MVTIISSIQIHTEIQKKYQEITGREPNPSDPHYKGFRVGELVKQEAIWKDSLTDLSSNLKEHDILILRSLERATGSSGESCLIQTLDNSWLDEIQRRENRINESFLDGYNLAMRTSV